jgi:hypothetical protein
MDDGEAPDEDPHSLEKLLRGALAETMLWPVFAVMAGAICTLGAGILLFALYFGNWGGRAALAILLLMSADAIRQDVKARGFGWISRAIVAVWVGSGVAAVTAILLGLLELG